MSYGTVRYGTVRYGMVWYGMVWYGMVWPEFIEDINRFTEKMSNLVQNTAFIIWPNGFVQDPTHELSTSM